MLKHGIGVIQTKLGNSDYKVAFFIHIKKRVRNQATLSSDVMG